MEQLPVSYYHTAREGEGGTRANFCRVLYLWPVRATHPITITVYSVANCRYHLKHIWANETTL